MWISPEPKDLCLYPGSQFCYFLAVTMNKSLNFFETGFLHLQNVTNDNLLPVVVLKLSKIMKVLYTFYKFYSTL